jgi:hypothetical protein
MINNISRIGNFTSSEIYKLMTVDAKKTGFGKPALTYILEKNIERRMGRSICIEAYSRAMAWGKLLERRVFEFLEFGYELCSEITVVHPTIDYWSGSADVIMPKIKVGDIKCYQPKNFALLYEVLERQDLEAFRAEFSQEYWQLVSNAIIHNVPRAESILYMPYKSELEDIRDLASNYDEYDQWKYRFISEAPDEELSFLPDGGYYKNLMRFEFAVPKEDKDLLTQKVIEAGLMLEPRFAESDPRESLAAEHAILHNPI